MVPKPDLVMGQDSKYVGFMCVVSARATEVNCSMKAVADGM